MSGQSLIYSNARVKAMESSLLTSEKITRMAYAESLQEAIKILYESNYGGGFVVDNPYKYPEILRAEENKIAQFMNEAMPDNSGLQTLLLVNDYHNAKCFLKVKYSKGIEVQKMLLPEGNFSIPTIEDGILNDNMAKFPKEMVEAVQDVQALAATNGITPRYIDITLDRAMYKNIFAECKKAKVKSVLKYWTSNVDFINISTMLRCKAIDADIKFFRENLIAGGEINDYILEDLYKESYDTIAEKLKYTSIGNMIAVAIDEVKAGKALVQFEVLWDNYLLDIFKTDKADIFSVAPIAGFYIAKKIELKMVGMILTCLKNKAELSDIKARLRGFYA